MELDQKDSIIRKYKLQLDSMNSEIKDYHKSNLVKDETILGMNVTINDMTATLESYKQSIPIIKYNQDVQSLNKIIEQLKNDNGKLGNIKTDYTPEIRELKENH